MTQEQHDTFAVILIKCRPGDERDIRTAIDRAHEAGTTLCFRTSGKLPEHACGNVMVKERAYCFGPFDFVLVIRSADVRDVERFVVECIRAEGPIVDTQTILGIAL
jgi:DNA-binding Lrp family transcriptional regulator